MLDRAIHDVGHSFEAAMRMIGCPLRFTRRVLHRAEVIEKQERVGQIRVDAGERTAHLEALSLQRHRRVDDAEHASHRRGEVGPLDAR